MALIRPRLNDYYNLPFSQERVDFAIPLLDEDLPLYVDPFLLWKSPSQQDNALHAEIVNTLNRIGSLFLSKKESQARDTLINLSECNEIGLGNSRNRTGKRFGIDTANEILSLYRTIPQINQAGFHHFEEIQLLVDNVAQDRISDITCNLVFSFLMDYTLDQCMRHSIPTSASIVTYLDCRSLTIISEKVNLPCGPVDNNPILFAPKRWLRAVPWINFADYKDYHFAAAKDADRFPNRISILNYNRSNYGQVLEYIRLKEANKTDCGNDPLFRPLPVLSAKRKLSAILKLPTGKTNNADKDFENLLCPLLASLLYPELDFAAAQSRTISGVLIRDLIFYNNREHKITQDFFSIYNSRQIVIELKNVAALENDHVDQLNRYLKDEFGKFGILFTRNPPPKAVYKNTIDLWGGQRKCILILTDDDIKLMCQLFGSKQRLPIDVITKKYVEFTRDCPG
jgi:hypothetical protein